MCKYELPYSHFTLSVAMAVMLVAIIPPASSLLLMMLLQIDLAS